MKETKRSPSVPQTDNQKPNVFNSKVSTKSDGHAIASNRGKDETRDYSDTDDSVTDDNVNDARAKSKRSKVNT